MKHKKTRNKETFANPVTHGLKCKTKIKLTQDSNGLWRADLPGMPPNGLGKTKKDAVADLLRVIILKYTQKTENWIKFIDWSKEIKCQSI